MTAGKKGKGVERPTSAADRPTPPRLLLVEDEVKVARFVSQGLREEGYDVDTAASVAEAEEALRAGTYQLLVLDWMLPDGDGVQLARGCRSRGVAAPILMLTARDAVSERVEALDAGADDYLVKPFAFAELLARVRALLRRSGGPATVLRAGDLELDLLRHVARRGAAQVALTAKEFAVLAYLARHPGRAVSRAELLREVWSEGGSLTANIVDVQIARLREKLGDGDGDGPPLIHTVRRIGYALGKAPDEG